MFSMIDFNGVLRTIAPLLAVSMIVIFKIYKSKGKKIPVIINFSLIVFLFLMLFFSKNKIFGFMAFIVSLYFVYLINKSVDAVVDDVSNKKNGPLV